MRCQICCQKYPKQVVNNATQSSKEKGLSLLKALIYARLTLVKSGTPGGSRTPNLLIRSQALYPIELRVLKKGREQSGNERSISSSK